MWESFTSSEAALARRLFLAVFCAALRGRLIRRLIRPLGWFGEGPTEWSSCGPDTCRARPTAPRLREPINMHLCPLWACTLRPHPPPLAASSTRPGAARGTCFAADHPAKARTLVFVRAGEKERRSCAGVVGRYRSPLRRARRVQALVVGGGRWRCGLNFVKYQRMETFFFNM